MADIKLFRPQRLTDNPDGGGLATAVEIIDGQVNNLFDDISRIDRVNGELSLRKPFVIAATADTALYSDLHLTIQAPPLDPRVSAVLFKTGSWTDERDDAKSAVERFLDESVISRMIPYDRQLQGQRTVLVYQRPELALPEIGEVYALKNDTSGAVEFVRVQDIDHQVETFTDSEGDYKARVITLTISQPLSQEFAGSQPNRMFKVDTGKSVVRKTIASDAARYKGVVSLVEDAAPGDLSIKVNTIFAQLVPSATSEVPVVDALPAGVVKIVDSGTDTVLVDAGQHSAAVTARLPTSAQLGVVVEARSGNVTTGQLQNRWEEQPNGTFLRTFGSRSMTIAMDATRSSVDLGVDSSNEFIGIKFQPAAAISESAQSYEIPVEIANRGYVYVATLHPTPTPGSTVVSFRAQGTWYTLEDDGTGALVGDAGVGSGLVNFQTGSVQVTLGALPDIGSSVIYAFGGASQYEIRADDITIAPPSVPFTLASNNCEPGTFSASWLSGGVTKSATDDSAGNLTGDATGRIVYATGDVVLTPALLPDASSVISVDYEAATTELETFNPAVAGGAVSLSLSVPPRPGSIRIDYNGTAFALLDGTVVLARTLTDNGVGQLVDAAGTVIVGSTVNYSTGQVTFSPGFSTQAPALTRVSYSQPMAGQLTGSDGAFIIEQITSLFGDGATLENATAVFASGELMTVRYKDNTAADAAVTDEIVTIPALVVDLTPLVKSAIVPGSVLFKLGGRSYYDRNATMNYGLAPLTGAGTSAGSIDYTSGLATITDWPGGIAPAFDAQSLLTEVAPLPLAVVHGRTPGSPLRPGTFYLQANRYRDGALIAGQADNNGNIDTSAMHGVIDVNTGTFVVSFGAFVLDSSLTTEEKAEGWYDAGNVDGDGYIWRPDEVIPGTVRFNCVVQTSLPQDPEIIKVNPVRLPMDGRVPVLRAGDTLVIADTLPYTLPNPLSAGQVVTLPRTGLASVAVYDDNGLGVAPTLYTPDLAAGTLTWADPLDLSAYAQPLVALHTIEDMALCLDAQITGEVQLGAALSHSYVAGQSLVSSALILGDAQGRYEHLYAQNTWTNVWSNTLIGSAPTGGGQYNDATWPVEVKNADAITQRWRINFTSATAFTVVGETLGVIASGTTAADVAPVNPATGLPYFTLRASGFGSGWATGNQIRFNTVAAGSPVWIARTVLSGPATQQDDRIRLDVRWDKD